MLVPASKPTLSTKRSALALRHMAGRVRPRLTTYCNCTATRYSSTLPIAQRIGLRIRIDQVPPLEEPRRSTRGWRRGTPGAGSFWRLAELASEGKEQ